VEPPWRTRSIFDEASALERDDAIDRDNVAAPAIERRVMNVDFPHPALAPHLIHPDASSRAVNVVN
jgi:hypothetical protein